MLLHTEVATVRSTSVDWRSVVIVVVILAFFGLLRINPSREVGILILAGCGWWLLQAGLTPWRSYRPLTGARETYWRGQRIVLEQPRRSRSRTPAPLPLAISLAYFAMSAGAWLGAVRLVIAVLGR